MKIVLLFLTVLLLSAAVILAVLASPRARAFAVEMGDRVSQAIFRMMTANGLVLGVYSFPEGAKFFFSQTFAAALSVTALTNGNPARATSAAHGLVDNDEILFTTSGWEDAKNSVYKADQFDTNTFDILGLVTTDTNFYPAGVGIGTVQKVSAWQQIPQVLGINTSGGDPRYTQISPLASRNSINVPTGFNPANITLEMGHDPADSIYQGMLSISRALSPVAFKMVLGGGAKAYGYGYMAVSEMPRMNQNQANVVTCAFTLLGRPISYAS